MFWKKFFIVLGVIIILAFLAQLVAAPYLKDLITKKAKEALGVEVSIENCAPNILKSKIILENVNIPSPQYTEEYFFKAKELSIDFYLIAFLFKKQILQTLSLTQPELILHRDETGTLKLPQFKKAQKEKEVRREVKFEILIKRFLVRNGNLKLIDHYVSKPPTVITFSDLNCDIINSLSLADKKIITDIDAKGKIEGRGKFLINGKGDFVSKPISFDGDLEIEGLSLPKFTPYYGENLSIIVKSGNLNIDSKALCERGNLDIANKVRIESVDVEPIGDPSKTILFELPTIYVIQFLKDENGTISFEFKVGGNLEKPDFRFGPEIQRALKQAMMRRISDGVQRLLENPQKAGEKIEEIGKILGGEAGEKAKKIGEQLQKILGK